MRESEYRAHAGLSLGAIIRAEQERRRQGLVADAAWFETWRAQQLRASEPRREFRRILGQVAIEACWIVVCAGALLALVAIEG